MNDLYSPHTGEHIVTDTPADWMLHAGVAAPDYNRQISGCFWRNGAWEVVISVPDPIPNPAIAAIDAQLAAIDLKSIRPAREGDIAYLATLTAQAVELRAARALLPKMV